MTRALCIPVLLAALSLAACNHELQIKNLAMYQAPYRLDAELIRPRLGVLPFEGTPDDLFFFNSIVERLTRDPAIADLRTDYLPRIAQVRPEQARLFVPDLVLAIRPKVTYRSSGWNFLINWPGFLIWAPAAMGYIHHADVMTTFVIHDREGKALDQLEVPMSFNLRYADGDRTIWAELGWLEVSALPFFSGIVFAKSVDRDVIPPFQVNVKDTYSNYVTRRAEGSTRLPRA
jgi:hypothetical protein